MSKFKSMGVFMAALMGSVLAKGKTQPSVDPTDHGGIGRIGISYSGNGEYHPRKHPKMSYAAQKRAAKKRRKA